MPVEMTRASDEEELLTVLRAAAKYRRDFTAYRSTEAWAQSLIEEREIDPLREVYLARDGDNHVAVLEVVEDGSGTLTIAQLIISETARFKGYGRQVVQWAAQLGHDVLSIGVVMQNTGAIAFWEALGFARTGRLGKGKDALILMERLSSEERQSQWEAHEGPSA